MGVNETHALGLDVSDFTTIIAVGKVVSKGAGNAVGGEVAARKYQPGQQRVTVRRELYSQVLPGGGLESGGVELCLCSLELPEA